jgi:hypothetical protein
MLRVTVPVMALACVKERAEVQEPRAATEVVGGAKKGGAGNHPQRIHRKVPTSLRKARHPKHVPR